MEQKDKSDLENELGLGADARTVNEQQKQPDETRPETRPDTQGTGTGSSGAKSSLKSNDPGDTFRQVAKRATSFRRATARTEDSSDASSWLSV